MRGQKENYNITQDRFKDYNANCIARGELMFKFIFYARKLARKRNINYPALGVYGGMF